MDTSCFPTSKDIFVEINGVRVGVVESYKIKSIKESRSIEAFGQCEPIATIGGRIRHTLELSRISVLPQFLENKLDFFSLENFSVSIVKPEEQLLFTDCEWCEISENATLNELILEKLALISAKRDHFNNQEV